MVVSMFIMNERFNKRGPVKWHCACNEEPILAAAAIQYIQHAVIKHGLFGFKPSRE